MRTEAPDLSGLTFDATWLNAAHVPAPDRKQEAAGLEVPAAASLFASGLSGHNKLVAEVGHSEASLNQTLSETGPWSIRLREQYEGLGLLLQKAGEHEKAVAAFESAVQIDRVNEGLYTPKQIPLVRHIIASYLARSNLLEAAQRHEYLYLVQRRNYAPDSSELLAANEELADWNAQYFFIEEASQALSRNTFGFSAKVGWGARPDYVRVYNPGTGHYAYVSRAPLASMPDAVDPFVDPMQDFYGDTSGFGVSTDATVDARLRRAHNLYVGLLTSANSDYRKNRGVRLEQKLANVGIAIKRQLDPVESNHGAEIDQPSQTVESDTGSSLFNRLLVRPEHGNPAVQVVYAGSRDSLQALAQRLEQDAGSSRVDVARAYINLGDWHLSFDHTQGSFEAYDKALHILLADGRTAAEIAGMFNPSPLIAVPAFVSQPYSKEYSGFTADRALQYEGYIDLSLTLTQNGEVKAVHIIDNTANTSSQLRRLLLDYLQGQRMRPITMDGKLVTESMLAVRISYAY